MSERLFGRIITAEVPKPDDIDMERLPGYVYAAIKDKQDTWERSMLGTFIKRAVEAERKPKVCTAVLIMNEKNECLLGKRSNPKDSNAYWGGHWGLPGGRAEYGESLEECATREVYEETRIKVDNLQFWTVTQDVWPSTGILYVAIIYVSFVHSAVPFENLEKDKCDELKWFNLESKNSDKLPLLMGPLNELFHNKEKMRQFANMVASNRAKKDIQILTPDMGK